MDVAFLFKLSAHFTVLGLRLRLNNEKWEELPLFDRKRRAKRRKCADTFTFLQLRTYKWNNDLHISFVDNMWNDVGRESKRNLQLVPPIR